MERVPRGTCESRFALRMPKETRDKLMWLSVRMHRSGNSIVRVAIQRMYEDERRAMLIQAGFPDGKVP